MNEPHNKLQYRPCVGIMLMNSERKVFVGRRLDNTEGDRWQMPQGGVDPGEDLDTAMLRELGEETGVAPENVKIAARLPKELFYKLPAELKGKLWGGRYCGQRQTWYLVRFTGNNADININAHNTPEFSHWKWVDPDELPELIVPFKREVYQTVVDGFRSAMEKI